MLLFEIPPNKIFEIEHLILDFNGTIAVGGVMIPGVARRLRDLSSRINIHVITADTNEAALSICVIQAEGAAVKTICAARIVCHDISDALDLLLKPHRIKATLRN